MLVSYCSYNPIIKKSKLPKILPSQPQALLPPYTLLTCDTDKHQDIVIFKYLF